MPKRLKTPILVTAVFDHRTRMQIRQLTYKSREYLIEKVSYGFTLREGNTLVHVFGAKGEGVLFRLELNTDSLAWTVTEVHFDAFSDAAFQP